MGQKINVKILVWGGRTGGSSCGSSHGEGGGGGGGRGACPSSVSVTVGHAKNIISV